MPSADVSFFPAVQRGQIRNLYGRSIGAAFPHRFLPRPKGGLFAWDSVGHFSTVILVEGLFDLAVLWQAGFRNTTCALGTQLTTTHLAQLSEQPGRVVYIVFDQDENQAGQLASHRLAVRLQNLAIRAHIVQLPVGMTPTVTFLPVRMLTISLPASDKHARYESLPDPSTIRSRQRFTVSLTRRARPGDRLGQCFSGCSMHSSTLAALATRLCF